MATDSKEPIKEGNDDALNESDSSTEAPAEVASPSAGQAEAPEAPAQSPEAPAEAAKEETGAPEEGSSAASETEPEEAKSAPEEAKSAPGADKTSSGEEAAESKGEAESPEPDAGNPEDAENTEAKAESTETKAEDAPEPPALVPEREPPHIESISPDHGPMRGGTRLTITGQRFADGCTIRIGETEVEATFESETTLVATTPERDSFGFVDVVVKNPDGKSEPRIHGFQYDIPPLPEFVKPDTLGPNGGAVRIFGEAFAEGIVVTMNGLPVPVVYKGEDCLELTIPAANPGPVDLTLTNPDGQSATLSGKLRFAEGPVIESVSPGTGLPLGGTRVTITGRNFNRGSTITLLGKLAPQLVFESEKKISFVAPPYEPGIGAVRVTNPDGLTTVMDNAFEYRAAPPPVVESLSPDRAWVTGGSRVIVSGSDLSEGASVTIGGTKAAVTWKNGGLLEVIVPAGTEPMQTELVVENPDGQSTQTVFTYERVPTPPKLITVTPNRGPTHGGVTVVLTGDNFDEETKVRIAEVSTTTKVLSKTEMEVLVPPRAKEGPVAIEMIGDGGVAVRFEAVFYYNDQPPPKITGVAPNQGPMSGNTRVSLEGEGFSKDCWIRIGRERPKSITFKGPELIEIVTPPCRTTGFVDIEVGTDQTGSTVAKNVFRFVALPPPSIDSVAPNRGTTNGGTELSITGKHFNAEATVKIGGKAVKFRLISPDLLECKTPPGDDGQMVDVLVRNPDGKEAVVRRAFCYDARYRG